jgi:hypothetical protein
MHWEGAMAKARWLIADLNAAERHVRIDAAEAAADRDLLRASRRRFAERVVSTLASPKGLAICFGAGFLVGVRRGSSGGDGRAESRFWTLGSVLPSLVWAGRLLTTFSGTPEETADPGV